MEVVEEVEEEVHHQPALVEEVLLHLLEDPISLMCLFLLLTVTRKFLLKKWMMLLTAKKWMTRAGFQFQVSGSHQWSEKRDLYKNKREA